MGPGPFRDGDGDGGFGHGFGHGYWHHGGPLWLPLALFAANLLWPFVIGLLALAVMRALGQPKPERVEPPPREPTAMELLRERYVLGDIDALTFEDMVYHVLQSERIEREQAFWRALPGAPHESEAPTLPRVYPVD